MRHFHTLQTLWANRSLNHGRNPQESSQFGFKPIPRTTRRRFSHSEKLRIVQAADRCTKPGELGLLLRREGLFSSHLANWRRWRLRVHPTLAPKNKPQTDSQIRHEKQRLERENARLRLKLEHAEKLLALQMKMADILDAIDRDERQSSRGKLA